MNQVALKSMIKGFLEQHFPKAVNIARAAKLRRNFRLNFKSRQSAMRLRIYGERDPFVLSGPFVGMRYINEIVWGPVECKWLGTYEQELHPIINRIFRGIIRLT